MTLQISKAYGRHSALDRSRAPAAKPPSFSQASARSGDGFTIAEFVVAMTILAVVLAAATTFYTFQNKVGWGAAQKKVAEEAASLALMPLKRDMLQAGSGLREKAPCSPTPLSIAPLAVYAYAPSDQGPDELYLNCSDYLDMTIIPTISNSFFSSNVLSGLGKSWFQLNNVAYFVVPGVNLAVDSSTVNSVIKQTCLGVISTEELKSVAPDTGSTNYDTNTQDLRLELNASFKGNVAPAISYKLKLDTPTDKPEQWGTLYRNGRAIAGPGTDEKKSQTHLMKVTSFRVRCQFQDGSWEPSVYPYTLGSIKPVDQLTLLEVTVKFLVRDKGGGWSTPDKVTTSGYRIAGDNTPGPWAVGGTRTIRVSPRSLTLMQYL